MEKMPSVHIYDSYRQELATLNNSQFGALMRALLDFNAEGTEPSFTGILRHIWPTVKGQYLRDAQAYEKRLETNRRNGKRGGRKTCGENVDVSEESVNNEMGDIPGESKCSLEEPKRTDGFSEEPKRTDGFLEEPKEPKEKEKDKEKDKDKEKEKDKDKDKEKDKEKENIVFLSGEGSKVLSGVGTALAASPDEKTFSPPSVEQLRSFCKQQGLQIDCEHFVNYYAARGWYLGNAPMRDWKAAAKAWAKTQRREKYGETGLSEDIFAKARQTYGPIGLCL